MPPSCVLLGGFAIGARVALLWQHNTNPSYKLASIPQYDGGVHALQAGEWPSTGVFSTLLRQPGLWASTGGVLAT